MPRRKIEEKNIRKLSRVGSGKTYSITLPIDFIRAFGWQEKQKLVVEADEKRRILIIRDWVKNKK